MLEDDRESRSMCEPCYNYLAASMSAVLESVLDLQQTIIGMEQACMQGYLSCRTLDVADPVDCDIASKILLLGILLFTR